MWDHGSVMTSTPPTRRRTGQGRGRRRNTLATRHVPTIIGILTVTVLAAATIVAWWLPGSRWSVGPVVAVASFLLALGWPTPARPPRQGKRCGDRGQHNARAGRREHGGQRDARAQPPQRKPGHDEHGDQGSSPQERRTRQRSPASPGKRGPGQAPRPFPHLEDVLPQADAGPRRDRTSLPITAPQGETGAHTHRGSARRHTQDGPTVPRRQAKVLPGDGGARQRHIPRAPDHPGSDHDADVGARRARQMQVGAQGRSGEATGILHASTIPPRSRAIKRREKPCG